MRAWNISWGLPEIYEEATPFFKAWGFWNWSQPGFDFNPHFFNYPALIFYFNFVGQLLHYVLGYILGWYPTLDSYSAAFRSNPTPFILTARFISLCFDIGTVYVVDRLSRSIGPPPLRYIATPLVALNILMIQQSHLVNVDTPLAFFTILGVYFIRKGVQARSIKYSALLGIIIGLAASSKYTGAMLFLLVFADRLLGGWSRGKIIPVLADRRLYVSVGMGTLAFIALNPFIALDYSAFLHDFGFEQEHMSVGHLGIRPGESTITFYLLRMLPQSFGIVFCTLAIIGIVWNLLKGDHNIKALTLFILLYLGIVSTWEMRADRYLLPMIPLLIVLGSMGGIKMVEFALRKPPFASVRDGTLNNAPAIIVTIIMLAFPISHQLTSLTEYQASVGLPDTRKVVKEWILQHIPNGSIIASPPYGIDLPQNRYHLLSIPFLPVNPERVSAFYDTRWYEDFDVVVASDYDLGRYQLEPVRYSSMLRYYHSLDSSWTKLLEVTPSGYQRGPLVRLYRYPDSLRQDRFDPGLFQVLGGVPESSRVSNFLKQLTFIVQQKGRLNKVDQLEAEILSVEYNNIDLRRSHAAVLYDLGRYNEALTEVAGCLSLDSTRYDLFTLQGIILTRLQQLPEAEKSLLRALVLNPTSSRIFDQLLLIYVQQKDKPKALSLLTRYLTIVPTGSDKARKIEQDIRTLNAMK